MGARHSTSKNTIDENKKDDPGLFEKISILNNSSFIFRLKGKKNNETR